MKFIKQTKFGKEGNCLSACLASFFNINIEGIPDFAEENIWCFDLSDWLNKKFSKFCVPINFEINGDEKLFQDSIMITCIESDNPDVERHAVLSKQGKIIFDPNIGEVSKKITEDLKPIFLIISDIYR